jgi:hypothetical protein
MDPTQFTVFLVTMAAFFVTVVGLFIWNRTESRTDQRLMLSIVQSIQSDIRAFQTAMAAESKDFHGRLCAIEERHKER